MYDTDSVFNHLAHLEHEETAVTRRAIALAKARLERTVGSFLRGAVTPDGFSARFAACEDQFAAHVAEACAEVGSNRGEDIAEILRDHYYANRRWAPQPVVAQEIGEKIDPGEEQDSNDGKPVLEPHQDDEDKNAPKVKSSGYNGMDLGPGAPELNAEGQPVDLQQRDPRRRDVVNQGWPQDPQGWHDHYLGLDQDFGTQPDSPLHHDNRCPMCGGGQQPGNGVLLSSTRTADGNTDLGGPEPKIDKKLWTPQNLGDPKVEDGMWPTERKDVVVPIGPPNNEHELKEIDGGGTERVELDTADDLSSGFAAGGESSGPHTDTFGGSGQADPVTNTALV
jgi:hypothetical protein